MLKYVKTIHGGMMNYSLKIMKRHKCKHLKYLFSKPLDLLFEFDYAGNYSDNTTIEKNS